MSSTTPFFGYHMPSFSYPGVADEARFDHLVELVQAAEAAGFDMVTTMDHFYQIAPVGPEEEPMLEAYTTLGALAARTSRVKLGAMVSGVTYRNPALLAKAVTTLDLISGGRAILGLGAAWNESEHRGYGFEFPSIGERLDRLDEALRVCRLMFTEERPSFEGRFYRIDRALNRPRPLQPGGPQILVGGSGERRTLRLVARYADMSNWWGTLDELKHYSEVLDRHCEAEGRDPSTIKRTIMSPVVLIAHEQERAAALERISPERRTQQTPATPAEAVERLQPYLEAGFTGFIFRNPTLLTTDAIGLAAELIGQVRGQPAIA
ncbi:MAG TPA: LLM class F420-dependent oxidoreductase [Candidatus Limnocylindria bacterium]|jgi:F420-dependent oxidoreductase-like protein